jgi:hypothetical protein
MSHENYNALGWITRPSKPEMSFDHLGLHLNDLIGLIHFNPLYCLLSLLQPLSMTVTYLSTPSISSKIRWSI